MKTTIEIADPLMEQARRLAARQGTTVRALVELGLRRVIADRSRDKAFRFQPVTDGRGHLPYEGMNWDQMRDTIYEGRGT